MLDEADTFLTGDANELRGIVNSGHTRAAAFVVRIVGEAQEPRRFSTWAPMVIAGIGRLPSTIEDRSIAIQLRRKADDEEVDRLWDAGVDFTVITRRAARWADDHLGRLKWSRPEVPLGIDDRAADNWWPLLAIADAAGGDWPDRARRAAEVLSISRDDEEFDRRPAAHGGARARLVLDADHQPVLRSQICPIGERDGHEWRVCHLDDGSWLVQRRRMSKSKPWITRAIAADPFQLDEVLRLLALTRTGPVAPLEYDADRLQDFVDTDRRMRARPGGYQEDRAAELCPVAG